MLILLLQTSIAPTTIVSPRYYMPANTSINVNLDGIATAINIYNNPFDDLSTATLLQTFVESGIYNTVSASMVTIETVALVGSINCAVIATGEGNRRIVNFNAVS